MKRHEYKGEFFTKSIYIKKILRNVFDPYNIDLLLKMQIKDKDKRSGIYAIIIIITGDYYIGSTQNFHERKLSHLFKLRTNQKTSRKFRDAFSKYKEKNFLFVIIDSYAPEILETAESFWIDYLNPAYNTSKKVTRQQHTEVGK